MNTVDGEARRGATQAGAGHADHVIEVRGLQVSRGDRPVLHGVDLSVRQGEVVTLLGANGSGKSTLVGAIVGLLPTDAGSIEVFGRPQAAFRDRWRLGYVPQRTTAAGGVPATVNEVVASGRLARRRPFTVASRADRAAVAQAIELVGLTEHAEASIAELSGGQQQRVLIARAAAGEPDLLVLDEPNAGVDHSSQEAFARALRTFVASGRTVLLVLHELGPLATLIDRGVVLDGGRVRYDGALPVPNGLADVQHDHAHGVDETTGLFG